MRVVMGRRAVDTRKENRIGTRKLYGRILIVFLLILVVSGVLVGKILYLNKTKGNSYEKKDMPQKKKKKIFP